MQSQNLNSFLSHWPQGKIFQNVIVNSKVVQTRLMDSLGSALNFSSDFRPFLEFLFQAFNNL